MANKKRPNLLKKICVLLILTATFSIAEPQTFTKSAKAGGCALCYRDSGARQAQMVRPLDRHSFEVFYDVNDGVAFTVATRIANEFTGHRQWMINTLWEDNLLPALMLMSDQLSASVMFQTQIIGSFFDAKHQMETQRTLQRFRAESHKNYHPSAGMCTFGSNAKSLAASERRSELMTHVMSQRFQDRMLGNANTAAAGGAPADSQARLRQYRETFCDPMDNNGGLFLLCDHDQNNPDGVGAVGAQDPERKNKDIDFLRTVDFPATLDINFSDTNLTNHEEEVIALGDNLYGHDVFPRISGSLFLENDDEIFAPAKEALMDARAALAKLSVAYNSYNAITSMKASGTEGSRDFMEGVLRELGFDDDADIQRAIGVDANGNEIAPSYNAQMEILTKKIYQNPDFYTNLYDKPVNVERKKVAMQAIGLMQKFDMFRSYLRNEMNISVLLEIAIQDLQLRIENEAREQSEEGLN